MEPDRHAALVGEKSPDDTGLHLVVEDTSEAEHLDEPVTGFHYVDDRQADIVDA